MVSLYMWSVCRLTRSSVALEYQSSLSSTPTTNDCICSYRTEFGRYMDELSSGEREEEKRKGGKRRGNWRMRMNQKGRKGLYANRGPNIKATIYRPKHR